MGLDFMESSADDYDNALVQCGFGKFQFMLLFLNGFIYMNTAIGVTILSFVLPTATCDFEMTSADKGWLTASPMLGMLIGSYFWGCLADTKGRKVVLIATLILDGICGLISSISSNFTAFLVFRFFNGFGLSGAMSICFPYLGEFQPTHHRERMLSWMELFWTIGIIILPAIAWAIIPLKFGTVERGGFIFHSWNLFVAVCALPSLGLAFWLIIFPESPKFLIEIGDSAAALEVLRDIYVWNTGKDRSTYPVTSLKEKGKISIFTTKTNKTLRELSIRRPKELKILLEEIWEQTKGLCKHPHLKNTFLTCAIQFGLTSSYYTLMVWFPELFHRFDTFENIHGPDKHASVCEVSSIVVPTNGTIFDEQSCDVDSDVFLHTMIVGLACIPTSIWLILCVHRLGAKFFLVFSLIVSGVVTILFYFVRNKTQNLILSCIFEALTSLGISTVYCVMVDLFPTNLRVMAAALSMTFGRGGALLGNLVFGFLIDLNCIVPIVLFGGLLFVSGFLCLLLPTTGNTSLD